MNGRGYSGRYRPQHRRRGLSPIAIIVAAVLIVLVILFVVIGNSLGNKAKGSQSTTPELSQMPADDRPTPDSVRCYVLDIEGEAASQTNNNLSKLSSSGALAVSVNLRGADKSLLYNSNVAKSFGKQSGGYIEMSTVVARAQSRGMYVSAYLTLEFTSEKNADIRAAMLGYESALVSELCSAGVGDVMVYAPGITAENFAELVRLAENVKAVNSNARIGVALSSELFAHPNAAIMVDELFEVFDIIGLDLTNVKTDAMLETLESALTSNLYYVLRYNARVIVPSVADAELSSELSELLSSNSISNYQYVKLPQ